MRVHVIGWSLTSLLVPAAHGLAQHEAAQQTEKKVMYVAPASDEGRRAMAAYKPAPGLEIELAAAEPLLCNVVAFSVDGLGRVHVNETFRINDGVFDTRNYMQWKDADLALRTVAERVAKYEKFIPQDIPKYAAMSERVRMLFDDNRDGTYDRATVFADGFTDLADGIASGTLAVGKDVWFANIPKLWRLRDADGDGVAEQREAVFDGFGVHTSLIGHDLHGLAVGPDQRLYFSIGDRGFSVQTREGALLDFPHEGAVLRCELDGSRLEVVHRGLRNPQELAFDDLGDLFTGDNNSDGGDRARFVQVVEGADSGWRIGHQWLDDRGTWNREKLWWPVHPGQPAWVLPPIMNFADGPSGLVYDTGAGFPERFRGSFYLCDFRGAGAYSGIHAIKLVPRGAGHELARTEKVVWGILATDVDFAPDGSMLVSDWVDGWNKSGKGRLYRVRTPQMKNDLQLRATAQVLATDLTPRPVEQLRTLLAHPDRRVRQQAQFALVDRDARDVLVAAATAPEPRTARLHALWALGAIGRKDAKALDPVVALLQDGDAEVRAQTARVLGDARRADATAGIVTLLTDLNSRARREACLALAKLGEGKEGVDGLVALLRDNEDRDVVLRHAAAHALAHRADSKTLAGLTEHESAAVRLGVLLAMRIDRDPAIGAFLDDPLPALRTEALRAIHEAPVEAARGLVCAMLDQDLLPREEMAEWRALAILRSLGTPDMGARVLQFALASANRTPAMRVEALRILAEWAKPHGQDRVNGNWSPVEHPEAEKVVAALAAELPSLLADADDAVVAAAAEAAASLSVASSADALASLVADGKRGVAAREAALDALDRLDSPQLDRVVQAIDAKAPGKLRQTAVRITTRRNPAGAVPLLASLLENGSRSEKRGALEALADLKDPAAGQLIGQWLDRYSQGKVPAPIQLELIEAAMKRPENLVRSEANARLAAADGKGNLAGYEMSLEGGDASAGRQVFFNDAAARCQRCHAIDGRGGNAGPDLSGIGARADRNQILESLVAPSAKIADGFAAAVLELHSGDTVAGVVVKDQDGVVEVMGLDGEVSKVPQDRVKSRSGSSTSAMPAMGGTLTRRQLRDLVEYLSQRKATK